MRWSGVSVAAQSRAMLPVLGGMRGSIRTTCMPYAAADRGRRRARGAGEVLHMGRVGELGDPRRLVRQLRLVGAPPGSATTRVHLAMRIGPEASQLVERRSVRSQHSLFSAPVSSGRPVLPDDGSQLLVRRAAPER